MSKTLLIALGLAIVPGLAQAASQTCSAQSGAQAGALIELYTSEGCSSCPPADQWFKKLAVNADPQQLSLLAFHVDYWDSLGWRDRFSRHTYTERQSQRVRAAGSATIYTPQVMLSANLGLHWYQPQAVSSALTQLQRKPATVQVDMTAQADGEQWRVSVKATPLTTISPGAQLYLALYENDIVSVVKAGENDGVTLHHDRVVRGLWGPWSMSKTATAQDLRVTLPPDARGAHSGLTAFVQNSHSGETLQALSLPLSGCSE